MSRLTLLRAAIGATAALTLLPAAANAHVTRYASPTATATSGDCSAAMPCKIGYAINGASPGDEVVVAPGGYAVTVALAPNGIDVHGLAGQAPPLLVGPSNLNGPFVDQDGGTLRHLTLRGTTPGQDTLVMDGGLAENLEIVSTSGDGAKIKTSSPTTVLRDSVVIAQDSGSGSAALKLREGGSGSAALALRNVTAMAPQANAIRCEVNSTQQATLVNVLARGGVTDVDARNGGEGCLASHSNLRPAASPQLALGAGILSTEPRVVDAGVGDYRPLADSPTVDAGIADSFTSAVDPDGRERTVPDVGVFECCGGDPWPGEPLVTAPPEAGEDVAPAPQVDPPVKGIPAPVLGQTVVVAPGQGKVLVRRPGARRFSELDSASTLPTGTVVDARLGRIRLTTALDETGEFQTGRFWGSRFQIRQSGSGNGMTSLALRGGNFGRCPGRASALAHASVVPAADSGRRRIVRSLWARDRGGRFRTYGNNSVATARGTAWVTRDRCDGTVTRVTEGAVRVKNRRTGRSVLVRAGRSYLAKR
jgi:hypothetical protein